MLPYDKKCLIFAVYNAKIFLGLPPSYMFSKVHKNNFQERQITVRKGEEMDNVYVGGYNNKQQICISSSSFFQIFHKKPIMGVHLVHHSDVKQILNRRLAPLIRFLFFMVIR